MEKVNLKRIHSQAKVLGTVITVTGAMVMTLYKGPIVDILWYSHHGATTTHTATGSSSTDQHWLAGTIMILVCTCCWAGYFILQVCLLLTLYIQVYITTYFHSSISYIRSNIFFDLHVNWKLNINIYILILIYSNNIKTAYNYVLYWIYTHHESLAKLIMYSFQNTIYCLVISLLYI